jgi:ribosomal protein S18 acetylase RimI-like enzyme
MSTVLAIDQARPEEWPAVLDMAYGHVAGERRRFQVIHALHLIDEGAIDPAGILVARWREKICGVQVCVPLGGASFLFWLPATNRADATESVEDSLVQAGLAWCRQQGGKLAQAILPPADAHHGAALLRNGFARLTQLLYLGHDLHDLPAPPATAARFEEFSPANEAAFRDALAQSYDGTFDCPELNGVRTVDEILAGYRAGGIFRPELWWLVRTDSGPAGVVIITEVPEGPAWDLSYVGIVPEARRRGLARAATSCALHAARAAGATELVLAVDVRNAPARALYQSLGFVESEVRDVYLYLGLHSN